MVFKISSPFLLGLMPPHFGERRGRRAQNKVQAAMYEARRIQDQVEVEQRLKELPTVLKGDMADLRLWLMNFARPASNPLVVFQPKPILKIIRSHGYRALDLTKRSYEWCQASAKRVDTSFIGLCLHDLKTLGRIRYPFHFEYGELASGEDEA